MDKIIFTEEKETLLIPLYGKAKESQKQAPLLRDEKALEIVSHINYNFQSLKIPEKTNMMMCLRAKLIDNFTQDFLEQNKDSVALHLGCGLDSRYCRIGNLQVNWYDIDYPEVIELRKHFYQETANYHLIPSSVTEAGWLEKIPPGKKPYLVIAEGLLMYLREAEIKILIQRLKQRIGSFTLIFDAFSKFAAKNKGRHPSIKKTGAIIHWGIDDPQELTQWDPGVQFQQEIYFSDNEEIKRFPAATRMAFQLANLFPMAKKAQRILIYRVE